MWWMSVPVGRFCLRDLVWGSCVLARVLRILVGHVV